MKLRGLGIRSCFFLLGAAFILFPWLVSAQESMYDQKMARKFAEATLQKYIEYMSTEKNYARFDFASLEEARRARLGDPYAVKYVGLRELKAYNRDKRVTSIVRDPKILWFPVLVDDQVKTKLEILLREEMAPGAFGAAKSVKTTASISRKMPAILDKKNIKPDTAPEILRIPSLYAEFFHFTSDRRHYLIPALANPGRFRLQNGEVYAARDVLAWLSDYARKIDENKVM